MALLSDVDLLGRLVAFDTTCRSSNLPLARFLADYLERPGVEVRELPSPGGDKANLLVRLGGGSDPPAERRGLVLSGHMDVVPADDADRWTSDPFRLVELDGRLVARGACDMKGFLALAANLAAESDPARLRHPLVLLFTYDEEVGCLGAGHLVRTWDDGGAGGRGPLPRAAVIGEPTGLRVVRHHKGHLKMRLTYAGVSAHSAYPHLGRSAIEPAAEGVRALAALRRELEAERLPASEHFPDAPYPGLNVGTIQGGSAVNVVPDRCALEVGIRLLPGMDAEAMVERVRQAVGAGRPTEPAAPSPEAAGAAETAWTGQPRLEVLSASPPLSAPAGSEVVRALLDAVGQAEAGAVSYATDAGWLAHLGLECAVFGPGSIEVAHKPDEWLPKAELTRAREVLAGLIERFCVAPAGAGA